MTINEQLKEAEEVARNDNLTITTNVWYPMTYEPYYRTINWDDILVSTRKLPKEYYINEKKKTVVLKWGDGSITKVKTSKDDKFDAKFGFLLAYFQKHSGLTKTKANKYIDNLQDNVEKENKKN